MENTGCFEYCRRIIAVWIPVYYRYLLRFSWRFMICMTDFVLDFLVMLTYLGAIGNQKEVTLGPIFLCVLFLSGSVSFIIQQGGCSTNANLSLKLFPIYLLGLGPAHRFFVCVQNNFTLTTTQHSLVSILVENIAEGSCAAALQLYALIGLDSFSWEKHVVPFVSVTFTFVAFGFGIVGIINSLEISLGSYSIYAPFTRSSWKYYFLVWLFFTTDFFIRLGSQVVLFAQLKEFGFIIPVTMIIVSVLIFTIAKNKLAITLAFETKSQTSQITKILSIIVGSVFTIAPYTFGSAHKQFMHMELEYCLRLFSSLTCLGTAFAAMRDFSFYLFSIFLIAVVTNIFCFSIIRVWMYLPQSTATHADDLKDNEILQLPYIRKHFLNRLQLMIDCNSDINELDTKGFAMVHYAAYHDLPDLIEELQTSGADLNINGFHDMTPLHIAVQKNAIHCVPKLMELGCNINDVDAEGYTPYDYSDLYGAEEIISECLLSQGALASNKYISEMGYAL